MNTIRQSHDHAALWAAIIVVGIGFVVLAVAYVAAIIDTDRRFNHHAETQAANIQVMSGTIDSMEALRRYVDVVSE